MAQIQHVDTPNQTPAQFHPATAYTALVAAILSAPPEDMIVGSSLDEIDIEVRTKHIDSILSAVETYLARITTDTAASTPPGTIDDGDVIHVFADTRSDIIGAYQEAAHAMVQDLYCRPRRRVA